MTRPVEPWREPTREQMIASLRTAVRLKAVGITIVIDVDRAYAARLDPWRELRGTIGPWGSTVQRSSAWFTHDRVTMAATEFLFWLEAP